MDTELKIIIERFEKFNQEDIIGALKELEDIKNSKRRVHLQKLVYTDLVNRFDLLVDNILLNLSTMDGQFKEEILKGMGGTITRESIYRLLLSPDPKSIILDELKSDVQNKYIKKGHADKVETLLRIGFNWENPDLQTRRVGEQGHIFAIRTKVELEKNPQTILGYADWLYSRRNALIHGDGRHLEEKDFKRLQKYGSEVTKVFNIRIASIKAASKFYLSICHKMKNGKNAVYRPTSAKKT